MQQQVSQRLQQSPQKEQDLVQNLSRSRPDVFPACLQIIPAEFLFSACPTNDMTLGVPVQSAAPSAGSAAPSVAGEAAAAPAGGETPPDSSFSGMSAHDL